MAPLATPMGLVTSNHFRIQFLRLQRLGKRASVHLSFAGCAFVKKCILLTL